jgi:hypothetical protein
MLCDRAMDVLCSNAAACHPVLIYITARHHTTISPCERSRPHKNTRLRLYSGRMRCSMARSYHMAPARPPIPAPWLGFSRFRRSQRASQHRLGDAHFMGTVRTTCPQIARTRHRAHTGLARELPNNVRARPPCTYSAAFRARH